VLGAVDNRLKNENFFRLFFKQGLTFVRVVCIMYIEVEGKVAGVEG